MPATIFNSMADMAADYPASVNREAWPIWHRAFCYWQKEYMGNEFACWAAIQQYKKLPSKRQAVFIGQHWLRQADDKAGEDLNMSILAPVNPGSAGARTGAEQLRETVAGIASVKGWAGKLTHRAEAATLGATPADLFANLEFTVDRNFFDVLRAKPFDVRRDLMGQGCYAESLRRDVPLIDAAGFHSESMGLW